MCDFESILNKSNFKYLYEVGNTLPSSSTASIILKSHLYTKCHKLQHKELNAQFSEFKTTIRCPRCSMLFKEGPSSVKLIPDQNRSRFVRRIVRKFLNNSKLTKSQLQAYNKYIFKQKSKVQIVCSICKKPTYHIVNKPEKIISLPPNIEIKRSVKKKKKKDRFSGLNESIVLSLTSQTPHKKSESNNNSNSSNTPTITKTTVPKITKKTPSSIKAENQKLNKRLNKLNKHFASQKMVTAKSSSKLKAFLESI